MRLLSLGILGIALTFQSSAAVAITEVGQVITEDFYSLASATASGTLPDGWEFEESGWGANTTYQASQGDQPWYALWNTYSFGATGSMERALGAAGGTLGLLGLGFQSTFGASFVNATDTPITAVQLSFWAEQWRQGASEGGLLFSYSLDAGSVTDAGATWTTVDDLSVTRISSGGSGARDGNAAENRVASARVREAISGASVGWAADEGDEVCSG